MATDTYVMPNNNPYLLAIINKIKQYAHRSTTQEAILQRPHYYLPVVNCIIIIIAPLQYTYFPGSRVTSGKYSYISSRKHLMVTACTDTK